MSQIPHVTRQEYTLLDINEDGFVSVLISMPEHICRHFVLYSLPALVREQLKALHQTFAPVLLLGWRFDGRCTLRGAYGAHNAARHLS